MFFLRFLSLIPFLFFLTACQTFPGYEKITSFIPSFRINGNWFSKEKPSSDVQKEILSSQDHDLLFVDDLKGRDMMQIITAFGDPSVRRKDKTAEIWQYTHKSCILDLFIYEKENKRLVEYAQIRLNPFEYSDDFKKQETSCLKELMKK